MAEQIIMPKAGSEMVEGEIVKWFKKEGEQVKEGEPLLEIITDKVNMEIEAEESGVLLKILANAGDIVPVVSVIGWIGEAGEEVPDVAGPSMDKVKAQPDQVQVEEVLPESISNPDEKEEKPLRQRIGDYDVCVIGGGPAGYVAAIKASQLGGKVALVEKAVVGGTCLNTGCIPTKTYLHNAEIIYNIKSAESRGIKLVNTAFRVDMEETIGVKNKIVNTLTGGVASLLSSYGVKVYEGEGKVTADKKVLVNGTELIDADRIILAGGSKVMDINVPGIDSPNVVSSDDIWEMKEVPARMAVIGGGIIGCELGQAFAAFGSKVTIVEMADRIVANMDKDASKFLTRRFKKDKIKLLTSTKLLAIEDKGKEVKVKLEGKDDLIVDKVLLSVGRVPDLSAVEDIDIELERGRIKVDKHMETSVPGIYAPGDINGIKMLAHAAFKMGEVAAENAMGHNKKVDLKATPAAIYTHPEIASVGLNEREAKERYDIKVGRFNFGANGRALASNTREGFIKVIMDTKYHEILGVHIVGPVAAEIINEASTLIQTEMTIDDVMDIIHGHPTFSEALYEACADCIDMCIHAPKKK